MQVSNINNTNFNGLYKIPKTQNNMRMITNYVIPPYQLFKKKPIMLLDGMPQDNTLESDLEKIAKTFHGSVEWLYLNAKNFGVNIPEIDKSLYVITGETVQKFNDIYKDANKILKSASKIKFKDIINVFKIPAKDNQPKQIKAIREALDNYYMINDKFKDFYKENKMLSTDSPQKLVNILMHE